MTINLETLTYDELLDLNHQVVERLKYLDSIQALEGMMQFEHGSKVSFASRQGRQTGIVVKFNRKTVVVLTDDGRQWKVSPHLLSKIKDVEQKKVVVDIGKIGKRSK